MWMAERGVLKLLVYITYFKATLMTYKVSSKIPMQYAMWVRYNTHCLYIVNTRLSVTKRVQEGTNFVSGERKKSILLIG